MPDPSNIHQAKFQALNASCNW